MSVSLEPHSLFDRTIGRQRSTWETLGLVLLVVVPSVAAALQLGLADVFRTPSQRSLLAPATIVTYLVLVSPVLSRAEQNVVRSLRRLVLLEGRELERRLAQASAVSPVHEAAGIAAGLVLGLVIFGDLARTFSSWASFVIDVMTYAMMALFGWMAAYAIASTRITNTLLRQPMHIDPLDLKPFETIGRQSLVLALAFIGAIALGLLLPTYGENALLDPRFWLLYLPVAVVPLLVFFLHMRPTHRVLAQAREQELSAVRRQLFDACRRLVRLEQAGKGAGELPAVINALGGFEKTLAEARTWPYDTATLRTLAVSIFIPLLTVLLRRVFEVYIR
jgi:hypothetical protein